MKPVGALLPAASTCRCDTPPTLCLTKGQLRPGLPCSSPRCKHKVCAPCSSSNTTKCDELKYRCFYCRSNAWFKHETTINSREYKILHRTVGRKYAQMLFLKAEKTGKFCQIGDSLTVDCIPGAAAAEFIATIEYMRIATHERRKGHGKAWLQHCKELYSKQNTEFLLVQNCAYSDGNRTYIHTYTYYRSPSRSRFSFCPIHRHTRLHTHAHTVAFFKSCGFKDPKNGLSTLRFRFPTAADELEETGNRIYYRSHSRSRFSFCHQHTHQHTHSLTHSIRFCFHPPAICVQAFDQGRASQSPGMLEGASKLVIAYIIVHTHTPTHTRTHTHTHQHTHSLSHTHTLVDRTRTHNCTYTCLHPCLCNAAYTRACAR